MARLAEISNVRGSQRGRTALGILLEESPLVRFLDQQSAFELDATDYDWRTYEETDQVQTRVRGGDYTPEDKAPSTPLTNTLAFHGDKIDVDHSDFADAERGLRDIDMWLDKTMAKVFRRFARGYEVVALQGDPGQITGQITGLRTLLDGVTNVPGFSQTMVIDAADWTAAADTSFDLGDETLWGTFIENLIRTLADLRANGILVNPSVHARMYTIAQAKHILGESRDQFGNAIPTFAGYPFVPLLPGAITNDEPDNAGTPNLNTTSIYPMLAGEGRVSLVTNSGLDFWDIGDLEGEEANRIKWEIRGQWKIEEENVIRRIRNIKL